MRRDWDNKPPTITVTQKSEAKPVLYDHKNRPLVKEKKIGFIQENHERENVEEAPEAGDRF